MNLARQRHGASGQTACSSLLPNFLRCGKAFNGRGIVYQYMGDLARALADYSEAIRLDPNDALAFNNRGLGYAAEKDYDRAILDFTEAIRLDPGYADAYYNRGVIKQQKGDTTGGADDIAAARKINPHVRD